MINVAYIYIVYILNDARILPLRMPCTMKTKPNVIKFCQILQADVGCVPYSSHNVYSHYTRNIFFFFHSPFVRVCLRTDIFFHSFSFFMDCAMVVTNVCAHFNIISFIFLIWCLQPCTYTPFRCVSVCICHCVHNLFVTFLWNRIPAQFHIDYYVQYL